MASIPVSQRRISKGMLATLFLMLVSLLLSACNGDPQLQQKANQNKASLDHLLSQAQSIGVPYDLLTPIMIQEQQLSATSAPMAIFTDQPANNYYTNLAQRYQMLAVQVQGLDSQVTQQLDYQASLDLQGFENILAQRQNQGFIEAKTFASQLTQDQKLLQTAQYPKDYLRISTNAKASTEALRLMGTAYTSLTQLQQNIKQLQASHLDVTALNQQEQSDLQLFRSATRPEDYAQLIYQLNAHLQETSSFSTQVIPYVGAAKLRQFSAYINTLKQYGMNTTTFQQHLAADQTALNSAKSISDYLKVSSKIDSDIASLQFAMIQGQANYLLKQFHQEVTIWGNSHQYHDSYNGGVYNLDYEYDQQGIGSDADVAVQTAQTPDDYQAAIDLLNNDMLHLKAMEADYNDKTPWDQPHATDIQLMQHYGLDSSNSGEVFVVSLIEQTLRYYNNGKLVRAFQITSGQYDKPSPPGLWSIFSRQSPTVFKSSEPKGSAFWYPDTNINFAMAYHDGGYFFHDSWWRANYGVGTNFPHYDTGGDESFAGNGSHGCINMQEQQAGWLYANSGYNAAVILY
jgi:L,D-transpeptidase catalytic domain